MNALINRATKDTAAVTNTNLNEIAKILPGKLFGGELVQLESSINMGHKASANGLEEALLASADMDDLSSIEIDSGDASAATP